jgi:tRNA G46 methylase TrmB
MQTYILDVDPVFPKIRKNKKRLIMRRMVNKFEQTIKVCSKAAHSSRYFLAHNSLLKLCHYRNVQAC